MNLSGRFMRGEAGRKIVSVSIVFAGVRRSRGNAGGIMIRYSLTETGEERNFQLPPPSSPRLYLECNIRRRRRK